jgi:sarcosine oxidase
MEAPRVGHDCGFLRAQYQSVWHASQEVGMASADVVVVGLGIMGSAALHQLAKRGVRAVGIEQFAPGHDRGSSHGETRIIRLGYAEHPSYVPLVRSAFDLWRALERDSGQALLRMTGIVEIGPRDGTQVGGTLRSSQLHGLPHELLDAAGATARFPAFRLPADFAAVFQPNGGILAVEAAIAAQLALATAAGAQVRANETVRAVEPTATGVRIVTDGGAIEAGQAIVAAGPWLKQVLPDLPAPIRVTRQVVCWFKPADAALFSPERFPVFIIDTPDGHFYGFPADAQGRVKFAMHHLDELADPTAGARPVVAADEVPLRKALAAYLPAANGPLLHAKTCFYTVTPDRDFIVDRLPGVPHVIVGSPCSGHGFKFAPVIGEALADLATAGTTRHDIARFRLARFG